MSKLVVLLVMAGLFLLPGGDASAAPPRAGVWEGTKGKARLHLLVTKAGKRVQIANWTISCANQPFDDRYEGGVDAKPIRFGRRGLSRGQDLQFRGRMSGKTGRLTTNVGNVTTLNGAASATCKRSAFEDVEVKRVRAIPPAPDGFFDVASQGGSDSDDGPQGPRGVLEVFGGGGAIRPPTALLENTPFGGPAITLGSFYDSYCDGSPDGDARLLPNGTFTLPGREGGGPAVTVEGALNGPDAIGGTYRVVDDGAYRGPCDSGVLPFTATRRPAR